MKAPELHVIIMRTHGSYFKLTTFVVLVIVFPVA